MVGSKFVYAGLMQEDISLGEYLRRLRRGKELSLYSLSEQTGLSYSHLSRIENDSTLPGPRTVATLAEALGGDLKLMLEMANCLPRVILERIQAQGEPVGPTKLHRTAGSGGDRQHEADDTLLKLAFSAGLEGQEAAELASAMAVLVCLPGHQRLSIARMIQSLAQEGNGRQG